ncbi:threonine synthase [Candidatus Gottesmanbacteria bacterium]|nr:threonine synthase [Candidatus Gottesmanbacteria bacterium]
MKKTKSDNHLYYFVCVSCGKKTSEAETTSRCLSCGGPLDVIYDYDYLRLQLNTYLLKNAAPKVMKYLDFYPLSKRHELFSLNEGGTSLHWAKNLEKKIGSGKLLIKNEGLNPTGAFKDRGSFVEINKAFELGFRSVCVASTGNMAASVSAYTAQAGMECFVFVPEGTPRGKLAQCLSYGAKVIQVSGTYSDANILAVKTAEKYGFYLAGDYVFRSEGQKSAGFELAEQMWWQDIDWVIAPVGMGTNIASIWKGFWEYHQLGFVKGLPRLVAVQAKGCSSIHSMADNQFIIKTVEKPLTICSAIAVGNPLDAPKVIRALKQSDGIVEIASDEETLSAQQLLAHNEALYIEPSSATTIVALQKLLKKGIISRTDTVVLIATGAGLKDPAATLKVLAEPPTIEPDLVEVERVISGKLFALRAKGMLEKEKVLFFALPEKKELRRIIKKEFSLNLTNSDFDNVYQEINNFINKGKNIAKADLQSILETIIQQESKKNYLELIDFHVEDSRNVRPKAEIIVKLNGKQYTSASEGVGPVDAIITAIKKVIDKYDGLNFRLTDFTVEIPTTGSDATVEVTMVLQESGGTQVIEKGTSPDIFVASTDAFIKGYNELLYQLKERGKAK